MKWSRYTPLLERLMGNSIPEPNSGCWLWMGKVSQTGYGLAKNNGEEQKAHRLMYFEINPDADRSLCVLHKCDNRICINPNHLWLGTKGENNRDCANKGRNRGGAPLGNKNGIGNRSKGQRALVKGVGK